MKTRKVMLVVIGALMIVPFFAGDSHAKNRWYICTVEEVGPGGSQDVYARLTDTQGAFTRQWFKCRTGREREMLAVLLSALCNNMNVKVYTDPGARGKPEIMNIYLQP